ncbi:MAG: hypothetical protein A2086_06935 [Spirochaetes bacterium GWD1_27_9]|nr:MAG: hypothetical protein A2Y34_05330 [Spirochaetes bacterium GWC1_27_15]OHD29344.1 MAG: hypothetical protein A2086_06935 [Spirochaetes bacterium GWD1_27_9]
MKKIILLFFIFFNFLVFCDEDIPSILLPKVDIEIEDKKEISFDIKISESKVTDVSFDIAIKPDLTKNIKIDLEDTLPKRIDSPEKQKAIDAIVLFGYGLNNNLLADFSIFIKDINPKVSISYVRNYIENYWIDKPQQKNFYSLDNLKSQILFSQKNFNIASDLGYFAKSYDLQSKSGYSILRKKIFNVDATPSLKFKYQNDLTFRMQNSFLFNNLSGRENISISRDDFDYLLNTDITYSQVFALSHFFSGYVGYDFNYTDSNSSGNYLTFSGKYNRRFFNSIKAGASYNTIIKESFFIKGMVDFLGLFKDTEFFWYLLPFGKFGYSFLEYFYCYVEGGGELSKKPDQFWFKENDFVVYPQEIVPGYRWYGRTGLKGSVLGWFSATTDFEVIYNMGGIDWELLTKEENLYILKKRDFLEINLSASINFNYKQYIDIKAEWKHYFYDNTHFNGRDKLFVETKFFIPKTGLSFLINFTGLFYRLDLLDKEMNNIYLLNAGVDWNWQERFGLGIKFNNILYFQKHQIMQSYDEIGFGFLAYLKIGF